MQGRLTGLSRMQRLKAVELYKGKLVFYSLGNFRFDQPRRVRRLCPPDHRRPAHRDRCRLDGGEVVELG